MWPEAELANMSDEEFEEWYLSLSPQEQQMFNYQQQFAGVNTPTPAFGGGFAPQISPAGFDIGSLIAPNPDVDAKGNVEPWDVSNQAQGMNYVQDWGQQLNSLMAMVMGGPGSYDSSMFDPITTYSGPQISTKTPGRDELSALANMGGGGWDSYLAREIAAGTSPATAVGALQRLITDAAENPDLVDDPETQAILASLPYNPEYDPLIAGELPDAQKAVAQYDMKALLPYAMDLAEKVAQDPTSFTGYEDPTTGLLYQNAPETTYTKAAQMFRDAGLPMPTETYTDQARLEAVTPIDREGYATAKAADDLRRKTLTDEKTKAETNYDTMLAEYEKMAAEQSAYLNPPAAAPTRSPIGTRPDRNAVEGRLPAPGMPPALAGPPRGPAPPVAPATIPPGNTVINTLGGIPGLGRNPYAYSATPDYTTVGATPVASAGARPLPPTGKPKIPVASSEPAMKATGAPTDFPRSPTAHMDNGRWTFGEMSPDLVKMYSQTATNWSPMMGSPLNAGMVEQAAAERDRARKNAVGAARPGTYGTGANKRFLVRPEGELDQIRAAAAASQLAAQGRTPLTDAYMQRMMGLKSLGFG